MNSAKNTLDLHLISQNSNLNGHTFSTYFLNNEEDSITYLPNTNKINIFIGTNNSGKSRFIRELLKMEYWYLSQNLYSNIKQFNHNIENIFSSLPHHILRQYYKLEELNLNYKSIHDLGNRIKEVDKETSRHNEFTSSDKTKKLLKEIVNSIPINKNNIKKIQRKTLWMYYFKTQKPISKI